MKNELAVIPKPVSVKYAEGTFRSKGLPPFKGDDAFRGVIETASYQMKDKIDNSLPSVSCEKIDGLEPEAYNLEIKKDRITAQASSPAGMYHALQTIRQLSLSHFEDGELVLPCAKINDYPRFSWRGLMLDCSRYYYSVPFIKNLIDVISMHHINKFHWHLTDDQGWRLPVPEYPLLTEVGSVRKDNRRRRVFGGIYSDDEIKEVIDYAASRHIETIPEVDLPGHACAILTSYPSLGCTGGKYHVEDRFG
ncbi:MAG: family 20 glycosylhydrolase, partial [Treponema sp.]|nr:family 20 glycosylhydrolase [Treponema sp.]